MNKQKLGIVSDQLADAAERLNTAKKLKRYIESTEEKLIRDKNRLLELHDQLVKEKIDVEQLEKFSLAGLFYTLLGKKDEKLDKERQEYLEAKVKYDELNLSVNTLEKDLQKYQAELKHLGNYQAEYQRLLKTKEDLLRYAQGDEALELFKISEQESHFFYIDKELREALLAGEELTQCLQALKDKLLGARGWGAWDMIGGGLITTAIKHTNINNAQHQLSKVQICMDKFKKELADVQHNTDISIDIGGVAKFADYFFDGLIVDWLVQTKINNALEQTERLLAQVSKTVEMLKKRLADTEQTIEQLQIAKKTLIENA